MCSVHPPAPAKTAFVFFKQAVGIHRGMQSRTGFLLSPMILLPVYLPCPWVYRHMPQPASPWQGGRSGKQERLQPKQVLATILRTASTLSHPLPQQKLSPTHTHPAAAPPAAQLDGISASTPCSLSKLHKAPLCASVSPGVMMLSLSLANSVLGVLWDKHSPRFTRLLAIKNYIH